MILKNTTGSCDSCRKIQKMVLKVHVSHFVTRGGMRNDWKLYDEFKILVRGICLDRFRVKKRYDLLRWLFGVQLLNDLSALIIIYAHICGCTIQFPSPTLLIFGLGIFQKQDHKIMDKTMRVNTSDHWGPFWIRKLDRWTSYWTCSNFWKYT